MLVAHVIALFKCAYNTCMVCSRDRHLAMSNASFSTRRALLQMDSFPYRTWRISVQTIHELKCTYCEKVW